MNCYIGQCSSTRFHDVMQDYTTTKSNHACPVVVYALCWDMFWMASAAPFFNQLLWKVFKLYLNPIWTQERLIAYLHRKTDERKVSHPYSMSNGTATQSMWSWEFCGVRQKEVVFFSPTGFANLISLCQYLLLIAFVCSAVYTKNAWNENTYEIVKNLHENFYQVLAASCYHW